MITIRKEINELKTAVKNELTENILPFWMQATDEQNGGFAGRINGSGKLIRNADKGAVLNARILWTFSAAYRQLHDKTLLSYAKRAKDYFIDHFIDKQYGGVYWMVDYQGKPVDKKKQIYALGFAIYGLSEYSRATKDREAMEIAISLYETIEQYSYDPVHGGYYEAFTENWSNLDDVRLSKKDINEKKTMNTHLHILEPYTNLYRIWPENRLKTSIEKLLGIFLEYILDKNTYHLKLFFNDCWETHIDKISYGHDIEASWLLYEAAAVTGYPEMKTKIIPAVTQIAEAASEGILFDGSMVYERNNITRHTDTDRHWWVQAEAVTGYMYAYRYTGNEKFLQSALQCWNYIKNHLIDPVNGEWYWSIRESGEINTSDDKLGPWKCPYHNARMCLEIMNDFNAFQVSPQPA